MFGKEVVLQVMNVSPTITIYKSMKLGETTPDTMWSITGPGFNFDHFDLTSSEKTLVQNPLTQLADLFAAKGGQVGRTPAVKHWIPTEGHPV